MFHWLSKRPKHDELAATHLALDEARRFLDDLQDIWSANGEAVIATCSEGVCRIARLVGERLQQADCEALFYLDDIEGDDLLSLQYEMMRSSRRASDRARAQLCIEAKKHFNADAFGFRIFALVARMKRLSLYGPEAARLEALELHHRLSNIARLLADAAARRQ